MTIVMLPLGISGRISTLNVRLEMDQVAWVRAPEPTAYLTLTALLRALKVY